jgi:hypothetical protein
MSTIGNIWSCQKGPSVGIGCGGLVRVASPHNQSHELIMRVDYASTPFLITDEEDAKYRSFECLIATQNVFQFSRVMLCTFHAVWQPFKHELYSLLPSKKTRTGKLIELTEVEHKWGEY